MCVTCLLMCMQQFVVSALRKTASLRVCSPLLTARSVLFEAHMPQSTRRRVSQTPDSYLDALNQRVGFALSTPVCSDAYLAAPESSDAYLDQLNQRKQESYRCTLPTEVSACGELIRAEFELPTRSGQVRRQPAAARGPPAPRARLLGGCDALAKIEVSGQWKSDAGLRRPRRDKAQRPIKLRG